jgi:hypothetical protein
MRYLILSDIHANLEALEAVLGDEPAQDHDRLIVLGDLVGYGADPNAVVERIRAANPLAIVRGNHDKVAAGLESSEGFNTIARRAAEDRERPDESEPEHSPLASRAARGRHELEICHVRRTTRMRHHQRAYARALRRCQAAVPRPHALR